MQRVSPEELLQDALESFREVRGLMVSSWASSWRLRTQSRGRVNADREAIHQIFSNLIENALKYAASGRKLFWERARGERRRVLRARLRAGDCFEHLPRLFERFYRVDKARSRESGAPGWTGHRQAYCSGPRGTIRRERTPPRLDVFVHAARFRAGFRVDWWRGKFRVARDSTRPGLPIPVVSAKAWLHQLRRNASSLRSVSNIRPV